MAEYKAISLEKFVDDLNTALNEAANGAVVFDISADGDEYKKPTRQENNITVYTQGSAVVLESSIVPANGITVLTETIGIVIAVPIKDGKRLTGDEENGYTPEPIPYEESILPVKNVLSEYFATVHTGSITDDDKTYSMSYVGSQPQAGDIAIRPNIGLSIEFSLYINYAIVLNGVNSQSVEITFAGEIVPFTTCTITRVPTQDGGAFAGTQGVSKIYNANTALEIDMSVPALANSTLTEKYAEFLINGENETFTVAVSIPLASGTITQTYSMRFAQGNIALEGTKNIGQSVTLVEAL